MKIAAGVEFYPSGVESYPELIHVSIDQFCIEYGTILSLMHIFGVLAQLCVGTRQSARRKHRMT